MEVRLKLPLFYKASMITTVRLLTFAPSTTFWRKSRMGILTQFCITYACMEIQLPLLHSAHFITCKGHIINNGNNGQNGFNHLKIHNFAIIQLEQLDQLSQPHFEASVKMRFTFPKVGTWSPPRLPKFQNLISGVKTPFLEVLFIPLERS